MAGKLIVNRASIMPSMGSMQVCANLLQLVPPGVPVRSCTNKEYAKRAAYRRASRAPGSVPVAHAKHGSISDQVAERWTKCGEGKSITRAGVM